MYSFISVNLFAQSPNARQSAFNIFAYSIPKTDHLAEAKAREAEIFVAQGGGSQHVHHHLLSSVKLGKGGGLFSSISSVPGRWWTHIQNFVSKALGLYNRYQPVVQRVSEGIPKVIDTINDIAKKRKQDDPVEEQPKGGGSKFQAQWFNRT